jgi:hypothetical protein
VLVLPLLLPRPPRLLELPRLLLLPLPLVLRKGLRDG